MTGNMIGIVPHSRLLASLPAWLTVVAGLGFVSPAAGQSLSIDAPPELGWAADRVRDVDWQQLEGALTFAGLDLPRTIQVTLIADRDPRAARVPSWVVGLALEPSDVVIFPERTAPYPYGSLESVVRHEVAHLALSARAGEGSLPRWFHEGVAVSVELGWGLTDQIRLLGAIAGEPAIGELGRLFGSGAQPESERAYLLATALVDNIRRRHGSDVPGAVAARVAQGAAFDRAFVLQTGETVDEATALAWGSYLRWTNRILVVASPSSVWTAILGLALLAFVAQRRRRARRRRQWDEEEQERLGGSPSELYPEDESDVGLPTRSSSSPTVH